MKDLRSGKYIFSLMAFSNMLFVTLFVVLSYYNRIAADDFYFLANVNKYGVIKGTVVEYSNWSGRWFSVLLNQFVLSFYHLKHVLLFYGSMVFVLFIYAIVKLIRNLNSLFQWGNIHLWQELNLAVFFISAIFYSTFKIDETWFWLCASCTYLMSMVFFFLGVAALISPRKGIANTLLIVMAFTYIGGSCEPFALIILLLLILFSVAHHFDRIHLKLIKPHLNQRVYLAFTCCLISFSIVYLSGGNKIRVEFFKEMSIWESLVLNVKTTGMIVLLRLPAIIPYLFIFSFPAYYWGSLNSAGDTHIKSIRIKNTAILMSYFLLLYVYQLPVTYITQDIAAYRALFPITLFSLLAGIGIFYNLGSSGILSSSKVHKLVVLSLVIICSLHIYALITQVQIVPKYTEAYDKRMVYLNQNKNNKTPIDLEPLPGSGLLYSAEISNDTNYYANQHLKNGLGLQTTVFVSRNNHK